MKLYLAAPLFTAGERSFNANLTSLLRAQGHEVFLPQEQEQRTSSPHSIFYNDVVGIDEADIVIANMDGADPDSGTCWECGYAYAKCIPIVLFRTDFRAANEFVDTPYNIMLTESASARLDLPLASVGKVAEELSRSLAALEESEPNEGD